MQPLRIVAVAILVGAAICAADVAGRQPPRAPSLPASSNPLARELARCSQKAANAENDRSCRAAYAESRDRFFTPPARYGPETVELFPAKDSSGSADRPAPQKRGQ